MKKRDLHMKRSLSAPVGVGLCLGIAALALSGSANAQATHMILLDQTGSMGTSTAAGQTRWLDALNSAKQWVDEDSDSPTQPKRYAIYTYRHYDTLHDPVKVWPLDASDCAGLTLDEGYCLVTEDDGAGAYGIISSALTAMEDNETRGTTPLGDSLCRSLRTIYQDFGTAEKVILLESDGEENWSNSICQGPYSNTDWRDALGWDREASDWGMINTDDPGTATWEALTIRHATRMNQGNPPPVADPLSATDDFPADLVWRVDYHFDYCDFDNPDTCPPPTPTRASPSGTSYQILSAPRQLNPESPGPALAFMVSGATTAASTTSTYARSEDYYFFRALGNTPGSTFRPVIHVPGFTYGTPHALPGDVDDGGCVDQADLNIATQGDVWEQRAVPPNQIAMRADLDADGWVNWDDLYILLDNWASGCVNPVPDPDLGDLEAPVCYNWAQDGDETDVDCGGLLCGPCEDGQGCLIDDDCESGLCDDGICATPGPSCTVEDAIDLGRPGNNVTVDNASCLRVLNGYPSWWGVRKMLLQTTAGGTYPVPFVWTNTCTGGSGSGQFYGSWGSQSFGPVSDDCATLIELQGAGGNVTLRYWAQ